jgi:hypothetical protein
MKKEVLATFFLVMLLGAGALLTNVPPVALASTDGGTEDEQQAVESNDDGSTDEGGSTGDGGGTEPEPKEDTPPAQTDEPPAPTTEEPTTTPEPEPELPTCDGSAQDCITENGDICLEGQGGHECECSEDMSDCPKHPSLLPPLENATTPPPPSAFLSPEVPPVEEEEPCPEGQFRTGPGQPCVDCEGPCPEPPPTTPGPDEDCLFDPSLPKCASDNGQCPEGFFQNEDGNCVPDHPNGCPEGFHSHEDDETGRCIPDSVPCEPGFIIRPDFPTCERQESVCEDFPDLDACNNNDDNGNDNGHDDVDITITINKVIKEINSGKHHDAFPEVDIIGLSTKENGDSDICLIDIDSEHVQCQEFGMPNDRVNGDFWRVIETDQDKDYDNGNTGSNDIDGVIEDIKSQDFSELDDATNHDFGVDLAWVAINPQGEGFVCLTEDSTGKGPSLCEPFKVSSADVSGQITEGVKIENT